MSKTNITRKVSTNLGILGKRSSQPSPMRPGRRVYFSVRSHAPVWRVFRASIVQGEGVILITGEPGVGKTHFLNRLQGVLPDNRDMVKISDPTIPASEFLQLLMDAVQNGGNTESSELPAVNVTHKQLLDALEVRAASRRRLLVAIDQAHMLTDENASLLSLLIPFSFQGMQPVQVLLVGRPELLGCLESEPFKIIQKEIIGSGEITPLTRSEVLDFIHFYIQKSIGRRVRVSWFAWVDIFSWSHGNPFQIEQILNRTITLIRLRPRWIITRSLVKGAQQNELEQPSVFSPLVYRTVLFGVIFLAVGAGLFSWLGKSDDGQQQQTKLELFPYVKSSTEGQVKAYEAGNSSHDSAVSRSNMVVESEPIAPRRVILPKTEQTSSDSKVLDANKAAKAQNWSASPARAPQNSIPKPRLQPFPGTEKVTAPVFKQREVFFAATNPPRVKPQKRGSLGLPKNIKPLRVKRTVPVPKPMLVNSQEDRVLEQMVATAQNQEQAEILSNVGLTVDSHLPLTTEETLKSAGQIFVVQMGSFLNRDNAERLMLELSGEGLEPYVHLFEKGIQRWFSVRLNYRDVNAAKQMARRVSQNKKIPTRVIELFYE